jgi:hypothetical protein
LRKVKKTQVLARAATSELNDQTKVVLAEHGLDGPDDAVLAAYQYPVADLKWLLAGKMTGGDDLVAVPELVSVADGQAG